MIAIGARCDSRTEVAFGTITLTARANDANPEMGKVIFNPVPRAIGIDPSGDPLIEVRSAIYLLSGAAGARPVRIRIPNLFAPGDEHASNRTV
jgi:hypothetical protein